MVSTPSLHCINLYPCAAVAVTVICVPESYKPPPVTVPAPSGSTTVKTEYFWFSKEISKISELIVLVNLIIFLLSTIIISSLKAKVEISASNKAKEFLNF